jgi:hypothetical protein
MKLISKKKVIFWILTICLLTILVSPQIILAAEPCKGAECVRQGLEETAGRAGLEHGPEARNLPTIIGQAINYLFSIVGVIFLTVALIGGYLWMTAAGSEEKIEKAKKFIIGGINGMIVIFLAYALVYVILSSLAGATAVRPSLWQRGREGIRNLFVPES